MLSLLQRHRKILAFLLVGGLAAAVYAAALILLVDGLGLPLFAGSALAFAIAIPVSYFGHRLVTYRSRNVVAPEAARFIVVQVANLVITSAIVHFAGTRFGLSTQAGVLVAFVAAPIVSFVMFEVWVYRQRHGHDTASDSSGSKLDQ